MSMLLLHIGPWSEQTAHTRALGPHKVDDCHCFESWLHLHRAIVHSQSKSALNYATCWHRFLFMSAETRHGRLCCRRRSHRDIFLTDDVKGNDFVKQRSGCEFWRWRGKAIWDTQMGKCGIVCVGCAMRQRWAGPAPKHSDAFAASGWSLWDEAIYCFFFSLKYHVALCAACVM